MTGQPFDLLGASRAELDAYLAGRVDGYLEGEATGYLRGYHACDDELSAIQRRAHAIVTAASELYPWRIEQERRRQRQIDAEKAMSTRLEEIRRSPECQAMAS